MPTDILGPSAGKLVNPYTVPPQKWLKGQLHIHSTNSDGEECPHAVIAAYERLGYDFIALTDHNTVPSPGDLDVPTSMVVIPGNEYRGRKWGPELGCVGMRQALPTQDLSISEYVKAAVDTGAFVAFNHPQWGYPHWPTYFMLALDGPHAMEIYNSVIEWLDGPAESTVEWDKVLSTGRRIFGTACDDAHEVFQRSQTAVMVNAARDERAIIAALKRGDFYSTSGTTIRSINLEGNLLTVESDNAQEIRFYSAKGKLRKAERASRATCAIRHDDVYLRAELYGPGASKAWTNPVFVEDEASLKVAAEFRNWLMEQSKTMAKEL